jgi:hypothetical protein
MVVTLLVVQTHLTSSLLLYITVLVLYFSAIETHH